MNPLVSVIIPTHNRPQMLRRAIQSVIDQTFTDWELIVVQNGGTRESEAVVSNFRKGGLVIRYVCEAKPDSVNARNLGVKLSQGRYVAFLDDDDEWLPEKLQHQVAALDCSSDVGVVACRGVSVDAQGHFLSEVPIGFHKAEISLADFITTGSMVHSLSCALIRRTCFSTLGNFDHRYAIANDYDFYLRTVRHHRFLLLPEVLFRYYMHHTNMSLNRDQTKRETIAVLKALLPLLEPGSMAVSQIRNRIAHEAHSVAVDAMDAKQYSQAMRSYFEAILYNPLIGLQYSWGRFSHTAYRVLRPYLALVSCSFKSLWHFF